MTSTTLAISALGSIVTSMLYLYVGHVIRRRKVSADASLAQSMFVLWWQSLGYLGLLGTAVLFLYMAGGLPIWLYQSYVAFVLLVIFVALWGLQFYLVYLYTGSRKSFMPLGVFYAVLFMATMGLIQYVGAPQSISDNGWTIQAEPQVHFGVAFSLAFVLLLVGPQIVAAIAYARLYRKTDDKTQKYRIAMVTSSILVWFGSSVFATAAQIDTGVAWQLTSRVIGILGAVAILWAYMPPGFIKSKYGIRSIKDESAAMAV